MAISAAVCFLNLSQMTDHVADNMKDFLNLSPPTTTVYHAAAEDSKEPVRRELFQPTDGDDLLFANAEHHQQQKEATDAVEVAIVRPFAPHDSETLFSSFQEWDDHFPCDISNGTTAATTTTISTTNPNIDLVLSFSQKLKDHPKVAMLMTKIKNDFDAKQGWSKCFNQLVFFEAELQHTE